VASLIKFRYVSCLYGIRAEQITTVNLYEITVQAMAPGSLDRHVETVHKVSLHSVRFGIYCHFHMQAKQQIMIQQQCNCDFAEINRWDRREWSKKLGQILRQVTPVGVMKRNGMCEQMNERVYNLQDLLERLLLRRIRLIQYSIGARLSVGILLSLGLSALCISIETCNGWNAYMLHSWTKARGSNRTEQLK
jgi:hypothetical protein